MTSEKASGLSSSTAILLGSGIIALGLYFGLRSSKSDVPPMLPPAAGPAVDRAPLAPAKPAPFVDKAKVAKDAAAALDRHKKALTETCVAPALAKKPDPPTVKYLFNITFDAAGRPIARGVVEDRATSRPEVLTCISDNFPVIQVPPPGQSVLVDVPLELP
ncbi:MAG: hypothetical protein IPM54_16325 [Polyangiaceae bacterium]|nr:hypothetical protein [Polyangiaceae bacterium]